MNFHRDVDCKVGVSTCNDAGTYNQRSGICDCYEVNKGPACDGILALHSTEGEDDDGLLNDGLVGNSIEEIISASIGEIVAGVLGALLLGAIGIIHCCRERCCPNCCKKKETPATVNNKESATADIEKDAALRDAAEKVMGAADDYAKKRGKSKVAESAI